MASERHLCLHRALMGNNYIAPTAQWPRVSASESSFPGFPDGCCLAEVKIESLRLTFCRPKKNFSLLSGPKSQISLKGPLSSSLLWRCSLGWRNNVSNKQRWTAGLSLSFPLGVLQAFFVALEPFPALDYTADIYKTFWCLLLF